MKKMKPDIDTIVLFGKVPPPYIGPAIATQIILKSNLKEKYKIIHLDTSDHRDISTLGSLDIMNFWIAIKQYFTLLLYILKHQPKLIYILSGQSNIAYLRDIPFVFISKLFRKKVVFHLRGGNFLNWYNSTNRLLKFLVHRIQKVIDAQIVLGESLVPMFTPFMPREKIFVVPNGANFEPVLVSEEKQSKIRLLFLSNLIKTKGCLDILDSINYMEEPDLKKVEYVFAGSWKEDDTKEQFLKLKDKLTNANITIHSTVAGEEKMKLFASCDVFLIPTYYKNEGLPWVIIEAMSVGLPVIGTDHAALTDLIIDGSNGFIVNKQNPESIAKAITKFIEAPELIKTMGLESFNHYNNNFTEQCFINGLQNCFNSVIGPRT
jgi:glycosyltransferase involved in cell wall biosynthesis